MNMHVCSNGDREEEGVGDDIALSDLDDGFKGSERGGGNEA